jgi:hypothetical protein
MLGALLDWICAFVLAALNHLVQAETSVDITSSAICALALLLQ